MEYDPKDQDIIDLLTKLKNTTGEYPHKLQAPRRTQYLKYAAQLGFGIGIGTQMAAWIKGSNAFGSSQVKSKLLEIALAVAIVAEAGTLAYFYRDKIAELIQTTPTSVIAPSVKEVTAAPALVSPLPQITFTALETPTPADTPTVIQSSTPLPGVTANNPNREAEVRVTSTPNPNDNGNNGNHYGQTPKPERTKRNR